MLLWFTLLCSLSLSFSLPHTHVYAPPTPPRSHCARARFTSGESDSHHSPPKVAQCGTPAPPRPPLRPLKHICHAFTGKSRPVSCTIRERGQAMRFDGDDDHHLLTRKSIAAAQTHAIGQWWVACSRSNKQRSQCIWFVD